MVNGLCFAQIRDYWKCFLLQNCLRIRIDCNQYGIKKYVVIKCKNTLVLTCKASKLLTMFLRHGLVLLEMLAFFTTL